MATRLKDTDVVIIGLGAAGGVAALPLAQAGLDVIGLEAGYVADAPRLRARRAAQQLPRLAEAVQKANQEIPTSRATASSPTGPRGNIHPMHERRRRHHAALLGAELAAQPVGLQGRQRDDAPLRRLADSRRAPPSRTGRSATRSSSRTTTRSSTRSASPGRPATSTARSIRAATSSKAPRKRAYPMPPLRGTAFIDKMAACRQERRLAPVSRPGRDQLAHLSEPIGRACITASATAAAATSTPRTRPR